MSDSPRIEQLNSLLCFQNGIWSHSNADAHFDYSDGAVAEANLQTILASTVDLSSLSVELEQKYTDWASEYHLSPLRANLLRSLKLAEIKTALEVGSGCGALSRYLGEQGLTVDAIEGSRRRAEIAQLRCRDFPNVHFISDNVFHLTLPKSYYDAIFFIGVMEYAGRFSPTDDTAEAAVTRLLRMARSSLSKEGVIVIAIENRLGLKYLYGAGEDHYGTAFEGIHGYPNYTGIKTWSRSEWHSLLQSMELEFEFLYPFPDYKLPSLVLSQHYLDRNPGAWVHLSSIPLRDYHKLASFPETQPFWETAQQAGCLEEFSNSFLIIAGESRKQVQQVAAFDLLHTSTLARRPEYRTVTRIPRDTDTVEKIYLHTLPHLANATLLRHHLTTEPFREGLPLSAVWIQRLRIDPQQKLLLVLTTAYFHHLRSRFNEAADPRTLLDELPMNIMVCSTGEWRSFDHEWSTSVPIDAPFIFFRGLFYFFQHARHILRALYRTEQSCTLQTVLERCATAAGLELSLNLEQYIDLEEQIQETALATRKGITTRDFLRLRMFPPRQTVQLFWAPPGEQFSEHRSQTNFVSIGDDLQSFAFTLPEGNRPPLQLRIDPGVDPGLFNLPTIRTDWLRKSELVTLQELDPTNGSSDRTIMYQNISPYRSDLNPLLLSLNQDPNIVWQLPANQKCNNDGRLQITVQLQWLDSLTTKLPESLESQHLPHTETRITTSRIFDGRRLLSRLFNR